MSGVLSWLERNQSVLIPLSTALISAAVALTVTLLTQSALSRRTNREYLTKKLEEFYILLNQHSAENVAKFVKIKNSYDGKKRLDSDAITALHTATVDLNGKMGMYIELYFPLLSESYKAVLLKQSNLHHLLEEMKTVTPPDLEELKIALKDLGNCIHMMERKIVQDRRILINNRSKII
jgi:hypothetical protein